LIVKLQAKHCTAAKTNLTSNLTSSKTLYSCEN